MARKSPRSRKKAAKKAGLPASPRVRSAPGRSRTKASRAAHTLAGARGTASSKRAKKKPARPRRAPKAPPKRKFFAPDPARVAWLLDQLAEAYPDARCALDFRTPLQLLIATILSAQCT